MTRARVRIDVDYGGIGRLATGDDLRADLQRRAERVRAAAQAAVPEMQEGAIVVDATTRVGRDRVRGIVTARHPGVLYAEARHRFLGRAIDAAGN
ncbi:hypothetical protein [Streptomyces sp. MP131-18]|uniref:hypothetical protein n=1 Tax=Streptomyces sp. MP131-18 TaxID=1857892 RepID=UPI00097BF759|nr:hypothetical protein [Streptomyces sp. MP131-18]ONK09438.1 hypothetical protein STBA_01380 [Streptomyces sp. MP131-18]